MASVNTSGQQSFFDLAIQKLGSCEAAFLLALENGLSLTDELAPGTALNLPVVWNSKVAEYFDSKNIAPATYTNGASPQNENAGVTYWSNDLNRESGTRVSERQSLMDIAIQKGGSLETVVQLALLNGLSITETLNPGQLLQLPDTKDSDIVSYYANKGIVPETASDQSEDSLPVLEGIGHWAIETDFIVS